MYEKSCKFHVTWRGVNISLESRQFRWKFMKFPFKWFQSSLEIVNFGIKMKNKPLKCLKISLNYEIFRRIWAYFWWNFEWDFMWAIKNGDSLSIGKHKNAKRQILLEPECRIQFIWHVVKTVPEFNQPHLATDYNIFQNKYMVNFIFGANDRFRTLFRKKLKFSWNTVWVWIHRKSSEQN